MIRCRFRWPPATTALRGVPAAMAFLLLSPWPVHAQPRPTAGQVAEVLGPLLDQESVLVARLDLARVDPEAIVAKVRSLLGPNLPREDRERLDELKQVLDRAKQTFLEAGIRELYGHYSLATPEAGVAVAALTSEVLARQAAQRLRPLLEPHHLTVEVQTSRLLISSDTRTVQRRAPTPVPRPDLLEPLAAAPPTAIVVVLSVSDDHRRALREMLPHVPDVLGGGPASELADGVRFVRFTLDLPPQLAARLNVQTRDAAIAERLQALATRGLDWLGQQPQVAGAVPWLLVRPLFTPQVQQDQVVLDWSDPQKVDAVEQLVLRPGLEAARHSARRARGMNQLQRIALALHQYHHTFRRFPPQAIRSKEGKPLLSWRVALLPFLENEPLYRQFRLDQPWDSEHNRRLLEKMPDVYADPLTQAGRKEPGLTAFLVPLTQPPPEVHVPVERPKGRPAERDRGPREPAALFDVPDGSKIEWITDSTSNTIAVLKVAPQAAVPWTKPEDWVYNPARPLAGLFPEDGEQFCLAAFADGSVRVLPPTLAPDVFRLLLLVNDGRPIPQF